MTSIFTTQTLRPEMAQTAALMGQTAGVAYAGQPVPCRYSVSFIAPIAAPVAENSRRSIDLGTIKEAGQDRSKKSWHQLFGRTISAGGGLV